MPVVSSTSALRDLVVAGNDEAFAETVRLEFRDGARTDPDRADRDIEAVLRTRDEATSNISGGRVGDWKSEVRAGGAQLFIDQTKYSDLDIRKGDAIVATTRHGSPRWKVLDTNPRGHTRLVVELTDA